MFQNEQPARAGRKRASKGSLNNSKKKRKNDESSEESEGEGEEDEEGEDEEGELDEEEGSDEEKNGSDGNKSDSSQSKDVPKHFHVSSPLSLMLKIILFNTCKLKTFNLCYFYYSLEILYC